MKKRKQKVVVCTMMLQRTLVYCHNLRLDVPHVFAICLIYNLFGHRFSLRSDINIDYSLATLQTLHRSKIKLNHNKLSTISNLVIIKFIYHVSIDLRCPQSFYYQSPMPSFFLSIHHFIHFMFYTSIKILHLI